MMIKMEFYWSSTSKNQEYKKIDENNQNINTSILANEALKLSQAKEYEDALTLINIALKYKNNEEYLNQKAKILEKLKRYDESNQCYNIALKINPENKIIQENKSEMLYLWAKKLSEDSSKQKDALNIINEAITTLPKSNDAKKYFMLKSKLLTKLDKPIESLIYQYKSNGKYSKLNEIKHHINLFEKYKQDILITITGTYNYHNFKPFTKGKILTLIKDDENKYDKDAIIVFDEKYGIVGYVANSTHTRIKNTRSASEIKNMINNHQKIEVLFIFLDKYVIARIVDNNDIKIIEKYKKHDKKIEDYLLEIDKLIDNVKLY